MRGNLDAAEEEREFYEAQFERSRKKEKLKYYLAVAIVSLPIILFRCGDSLADLVKGIRNGDTETAGALCMLALSFVIYGVFRLFGKNKGDGIEAFKVCFAVGAALVIAAELVFRYAA